MKRTYRFQKFDTVEKPKQESKPLAKENKKRSRISPPRRKIYSFRDLRISEDCGSIDLTKKSIETFVGLPDLKYLVKLNLDSNPLKSFEGSPKLPMLRWLSARNSPISRNPYFKLMAVIVFGNNITTINNEKVMPQIHKQATDFRESLYDELLKGRIIANLRPLRFIDTVNDVVVNAEPEILSKTKNIGYKAPSVQEFERTIVERSREQFRIPSIASICDEVIEREDDEGYNYLPENFINNFISQLHGLRGKYNAIYENTSSDFEDSEEESNNDITQSRESINDASPIKPPHAANIAQKLLQSEADSNSEIKMSQSGLEEEISNEEMKANNSLFEEEEEKINDQIGSEKNVLEEEEEEKNENENIESDNIKNADLENKEEEEKNENNENANSSEHQNDIKDENDNKEEENQNENVDNEKRDKEDAELNEDGNEHSIDADANKEEEEKSETQTQDNSEEEEKGEIKIQDNPEEEEKSETEKNIDNPEEEEEKNESNLINDSDQNNQEDQNENLSEDSS